MPRPSKLTPEQWAAARRRWEGCDRIGFAWLREEVLAAFGDAPSRPAMQQMAESQGWKKGGPPSEPIPPASASRKVSQPPAKATAPSRKVTAAGDSNPAAAAPEAAAKPRTAQKAEKPPGYAGTGRPGLYRPEYAEQIIAFFDVEPYKEVTVEGRSGPRVELVPNTFPTLQRFAHRIGVRATTVSDWATAVDSEGKPRHPEFAEAYARARELQEALFVEGTVAGVFSDRFAPFMAKNMFGWKDKTEVAVEVDPVSVEHLQEVFVKRMEAAQERMAEVYARRRAARLAADAVPISTLQALTLAGPAGVADAGGD